MNRNKNTRVGGWTRFYAERQFAADMDRLHELGDALTGAPSWAHDTVYTQLRNDMSLEARKAVFGGWPTTAAHFKLLWDGDAV